MRKKYKKAVDTGRRSGGGRTVATFYDICNEIWGGCPATANLENGLDSSLETANFEVVAEFEANDTANNSEDNGPEVNTFEVDEVAGSTSQVKSVGHHETPEGEEETPTSSRRSLIEHIKEKRDSKLTKTKAIDQQQLAVLREELTIKKEMLSDMKLMDKQYQNTMARFASSMENLSQSVSSAFNTMSSMIVPPPGTNPWHQHYLQPRQQPYNTQVTPITSDSGAGQGQQPFHPS